VIAAWIMAACAWRLRVARPGPAERTDGVAAAGGGSLPFLRSPVDKLDGAAAHASQRLNFAVVAKAPSRRMLTFAEERGWRHLQRVSSANKPTTAIITGRPDGSQVPMLDAFHRDGKPSAASGARSLPTGRATLDRIIAASARLSLGKPVHLTREGRPTDSDEQISYP
jgi:hypothetical protein